MGGQVSAPSSSCTPQQSEKKKKDDVSRQIKKVQHKLNLSSIYLVGLGAVSKGTSWKDLPVVEHALWEGLASGVGPQVSCEAEGLIDRQVGLDHKHGGAGSLCLLKHVSSPPVQHTIDSSNCVLRALERKVVIIRH